MPTERQIYLTDADTLELHGAGEVKLVRIIDGMAIVEVRCDGMIAIEQHDPIREAVAASQYEPVPTYIEVQAEVRYWEDAKVNGVEDVDGTLIPFRDGDAWRPVIRLEDGVVMDWPPGITADVHYKVCDAGEYWLLDQHRHRMAKWGGHYVPDNYLCHGDKGYGDYIIFRVGADGSIANYVRRGDDRAFVAVEAEAE